MDEFRLFGEERIKYTVETVADYKEIIDVVKEMSTLSLW